MKSRISKRWVAWPIIAAVAMLALMMSSAQVTQAVPAQDQMSVTNPAVVGVGNEFDAAVNIDDATTGYKGYQAYLEWDDTILVGVDPPGVTYTGIGGAVIEALPVWIDGVGTDGVQFGAALLAGAPPTNATGKAADVRLQCIAAGTSLLTLVDLIASPAFGTTQLAEGGLIISTPLVSSSVECQIQSDLEVTKSHDPEPMVAGSVSTYTVTVHNIGPQPAKGVVIIDMVPEDKVIQGIVEDPVSGSLYLYPPVGGLDVDMDTVPDVPCAYYAMFPNPLPPFDPPVLFNVVLCYAAGASDVDLQAPLPQLEVSQSVKLVIPVIPDLSSAGKVNINWATAILVGAPLTPETEPTSDPNPANNEAYDFANIAPASVSIEKHTEIDGVPTGVVLVGDDYEHVITIHSEGPSPATSVIVTDNLDDPLTTYVGTVAVCDTESTTIVSEPAVGAVGGTVEVSIDSPMPISETCTITITVNAALAGQTTNRAEVCWADPLCNDDSVVTIHLPPYNGLVKDARPDVDGMQDTVNLWLCKSGPDCHVEDPETGAQIGKGILDVAEFIFLRRDVDSPNDGPETVDVSGTNEETFTSVAGTCDFLSGGDDFICEGTFTGTISPDASPWMPITGGAISGTDTIDWSGWTPAVPCGTVEGTVTGAISGAITGVFCEEPGPSPSHSFDLDVVLDAPGGALDMLGVCDQTAGVGTPTADDDVFECDSTYSGEAAGELPEGFAAYEFQIKYDHKIFDVIVADAGDDGIDNDADTMVDEPDESAIEGWRGNINCSMTILTENWIMFGCVSAGQQLGDPQPVNVWLATLNITPDPDMFQRIRPTKDNGVVRTILDENCEVADIYASEPWPFTLPGGLTEDCTDITITIRMLEGDLNLDCQVDVLDEQIIAQRYGAVFGLLLYDPFYDLEPKLTDFDIDIKDLQFVFGRDGSECQAPIPNQDPEPATPDP